MAVTVLCMPYSLDKGLAICQSEAGPSEGPASDEADEVPPEGRENNVKGFVGLFLKAKARI